METKENITVKQFIEDYLIRDIGKIKMNIHILHFC